MNRFLFLAGDRTEMLKLAALCQFTLRGTPIVYYGTEIGLSQRSDATAGGVDSGRDAEARRDMPWTPEEWDQDLLCFYRGLIRTRRSLNALQSGARRTVHLDPVAGTYAYERGEIGVRTLTVFNLSHERRQIAIPAQGPWSPLLFTTGTRQIAFRGSVLHLELGPREGCLLIENGA